MPARRPPRNTSTRAISSRNMAPRLTLLFVVTLGATVLVLSRTNSAFVGTMRASMTEVLVPVLSLVAKPVDAVHSARVWVEEMASLKSENAALRAQVQGLAQWEEIANQLQTENDALSKLIHVVPGGKSTYVAARIVGESGGPYMRTALINGGTRDGIAPDQAVIGVDGLVGRIVEASNAGARVLLLTDINSRVPVIGEISRERTIAAGNNSRTLSLDYVEADSKMQVGERLLTSGDGGVFPPGMPVGVISSIQGNTVIIKPLADWTRTEYVSVVSYTF